VKAKRAGRVYIVDTSALIAAWNENYPIDAFPAFWERIDELVSEGRFRAPDEVLSELGKVDDDPHTWLKERSESILRELDEDLQIAAAKILAKSRRSRSTAGARLIHSL
jgi:hypothetical protein